MGFDGTRHRAALHANKNPATAGCVGGKASFDDTVLPQGVSLADVGQAIADGNLTLQ